MKKLFVCATVLCGLSFLSATPSTMPKVQMIGIVDIQQCVEDSKTGKEQTDAIKSLESQLTATLQETEKEFQEIVQKAQDADYRDSLSPEAERELMQRGQMLAGQLQEQKGQFYQILQQAEMRMGQQIKVQVARASGVIAKKFKLDLILPEGTTLYCRDGMDITKEVVAELDKLYEEEKENQKMEEK